MKKNLILIPIVVALAVFAGWKILDINPVAPTGEHEKEGEHGHEGKKHRDGGHEDEGDPGHEGHGEAGRAELTPEKRKNAGIVVEEAGPAKIKTALSLYGKISANQERMAHVVARFPGVVKEVRKRLGDPVAKGEVLAMIESNDSLRTYGVTSELAGTVIAKDATRGEVVTNDNTIFTVADLSTVWVDLNVFRQDFELLKEGQSVQIVHSDHKKPIDAKIDYISPFGAETTQTMLARCVIPNPDGHLRPGLFVTAEVVTGEVEAPVTVKGGAIQTLEDKTVVFVEEGDAFEAREVELGTQDRERVQIVAGILPGDKYVALNSFIIKAEIGKGEAEHEH
jgi:cobalt-zinc-cadmium efflux system membrane fusion protein